MTIRVHDCCGDFAENKDKAREMRETRIRPALKDRCQWPIVLDFTGVDSSTQSFVHALISDVFQEKGEAALDILEFKGCSKAIESLITTVVNYSLE
jgi:hypothetical protein